MMYYAFRFHKDGSKHATFMLRAECYEGIMRKLKANACASYVILKDGKFHSCKLYDESHKAMLIEIAVDKYMQKIRSDYRKMAHDLGYKPTINESINKAKSIEELSRIMMNARIAC